MRGTAGLCARATLHSPGWIWLTPCGAESGAVVSDVSLRELERRWRESGSTEDETEYLGERVRQGDLTERDLRSAAIAGSAAALRLFDSRIPTPDAVGLTSWLEYVRPEAREGRLRLSVVLARAVLLHEVVLGQAAWQAIEAAEASLVERTSESREASLQAAQDVLVALADLDTDWDEEGYPLWPEGSTPMFLAALVAADAGAQAFEDRPPEFQVSASPLYQACIQRMPDATVLIHSVRDNLVPWLLGYADPVLRRVQSRAAHSAWAIAHEACERCHGDMGAECRCGPEPCRDCGDTQASLGEGSRCEACAK